MIDFTVVKGLEFSVVFDASDRGDVKSSAGIAWSTVRDDIIASRFAGFINLREESNVSDKAFPVGISASIGAGD